jgi:hypothetical protein
MQSDLGLTRLLKALQKSLDMENVSTKLIRSSPLILGPQGKF